MTAAFIFGDEIFTATDLNRRAGHILDEAKHRPVTITRNDEAFALLPRKDASRMVEAVAASTQMIALMTAVYKFKQVGMEVPTESPFEWLNAFDAEEALDLLAEANQTFHRALAREASWDDFDAVLHEWHESAIAVRSESLAEAFLAESKEVPLTPPILTAGTSRVDA